MPRRLALLSLAAFAVVPCAQAAQPQSWRLEGAGAFLEGEIQGLAVDSDGHVSLAPAVQAMFDPEMPNAWCLTRDAKGRLYLGTGNDGRVFRLEGTRARLLYDANELEVHALAVAPDGRLHVGTSPDGAVYAVDEDGGAKLLFDPEEKYIWALAFEPKGDLYVATGGQGRIYRVGRDGRSEVVLTTADTHVLSLAFDPRGRLYAGTAPEGILYRLDGATKPFVVLDSAFREIKALAAAADGSIWAAVVDGGAKEAPRLPAVPVPPSVTTSPVAELTITESFAVLPPAGGLPAMASAEAPLPKTPKGAVLRIGPDGDVDTLWTSTESVPHALLGPTEEGVLVGTGNKGHVYRLRKDRTWSLVATLAAEQVTALADGDEGTTWLASSNPARVFSLGAAAGKEGTLVSRPKDAETASTWGRIGWEGSAPPGTAVRLETRSGNTASPDDTWSSWSTPLTAAEGAPVSSPRARYLQIRLTLSGAEGRSPVVDALEAAYLQRNLRPIVDAITVHPPGEAFQRPIPVGGDLEILGLEPDPAVDRAATARAGTGAPPLTAYSRKLYQKGIRTFSWKADDPNGDPLVYDVSYRGAGETKWRPLRRRLSDPVLAWDTLNVSNGRYQIRVVASDAPGNPPALALTGERESASFEVDNTPPSLLASLLPGRGHRIHATARDDASAIRLLEFSVDAGRWEVVHPLDGISDSREESYEFSIALESGSGPHVVVLRAFDQLGNAATARVDVP